MDWLYHKFIGCVDHFIWGRKLYKFSERHFVNPAGDFFGEYLFRFSSSLYKKIWIYSIRYIHYLGRDNTYACISAWLREEFLNASMNSTLSIVYLGLLPTVVPYFALAYVTSLVGASEATISLYLTPAVALVISWVWLGEVPAFIALTGGMVTVAGVCFTYLTVNKTIKILNPYFLSKKQ